MSQILKSYYLSYSAVGSVAQTGQILERLSDGAYLVQVSTQHGEDVDFLRVVSLNELATCRLYEKSWHLSCAVDEITLAYEDRIAKEKAAVDKAAEEAASDALNEVKPEQN